METKGIKLRKFSGRAEDFWEWREDFRTAGIIFGFQAVLETPKMTGNPIMGQYVQYDESAKKPTLIINESAVSVFRDFMELEFHNNILIDLAHMGPLNPKNSAKKQKRRAIRV